MISVKSSELDILKRGEKKKEESAQFIYNAEKKKKKALNPERVPWSHAAHMQRPPKLERGIRALTEDEKH